MKTIRVENIGPVVSIEIPIPESGVVVLRGRNGCGKSETTKAVDALLNGKSQVSPRRGAIAGVGLVEGLGIKLRVGKRTTRTGSELEVLSLDESIDPANLVEPNIADPLRADASRIKTLVALSGITPDESDYADAVGGQELLIGLDLTGDPLDVTARIKKTCEAKARTHEATADKLSGEASANRGAAAGVNLEVECDQAILDARIESTVRDLATARQQATQAAAAKQKADAARERLASSERPDLAALKAAVQSANRAYVVATEARDSFMKQLRDSERVLAQAGADSLAATTSRDAAQTQHKLLTEWEASIADAEFVPCPSPEEIEKLSQAKSDAIAAQQNAVKALAAKTHIAAAKHCDDKLLEAKATAKRFRDAAANAERVLTQMVQRTCPNDLSVVEGRLVVGSGDSAKLFAELSEGERSRIVAEVIALRAGRGCLATLSQRFWQDLDEINRIEIAEIAKQNGVTFLTAECSRGELRAELFGNGNES